MANSFINNVYLEGYLYDCKIESKVTGPNSKSPNTKYLNGTISIATDNDCLNVVQVHYSYVTPTFTKSGTTNRNYDILMDMMEGRYPTVTSAGREKATKLRVQSAIGLNEYYPEAQGDKPSELVSIVRNEGGFITILNKLDEDEKARNRFEASMVITKVIPKEADADKEIPKHSILHGAIFDFAGTLLPVNFVVYLPKAIEFFGSQDISNKNPLFLNVVGQQVSTTVVKKTVEDSSFGEPIVRESRSSRREYVITNAAKAKAWDSPDTILASDFVKKLQDREIHLAEIKKNGEEYRAKKNASTPKVTSSADDYNF